MSLILELSVRGSVVFLLVLGLDWLGGRRINATSRRCWWFLVALAFLVPVELPLPSAPLLRQSVVTSVAELPMVTKLRTVAPESPAPFVHRTDWLAVVRWTWLAGAVGYVGLVIVRTVRVQRRWSDVRLCTDPALLDVLEDCKRESGVKAPIGLVVSPSVSTVAILGWLRPRILLPENLVAHLPPERLRAVLLHELAHFHFADVPVTWLFTAARALHWFNPIVHFACSSWFNFREEAADDAAMRWMRERTGQSYGQVLLESINATAGTVPFGALGIGETFRRLEKRLLMIRQFPQKSPCWTTTGAVALLLAGVASFPLSRAAGTTRLTDPDNDAIWAQPKVVAQVPTAALDAVVGRYDYLTAILTVTREGDHVFAQLPRQPRFEIFPKSDSVFFWKAVDAQVAFIKNDRGEVMKAMHHQGGTTLIARRLTAIPVAKLDPAIFDDYVGVYHGQGAPVTLTVSREGNRLYVQLTGQPQFEILPKSETEFFLNEVNAQLTFVKGANGKVSKVVNRQAGQNFEFVRNE